MMIESKRMVVLYVDTKADPGKDDNESCARALELRGIVVEATANTLRVFQGERTMMT